MIIFGIVLVALGLLILAIAWRGRVEARGQFCRKCRFDLAGLDLESLEAKCPECGSEIHNPSNRRLKRRQKSRLGVGLACVMFIAGLGVVGVGATGKTGVLMGVMPDRVLIQLTGFGVDEALDELVVRISAVPATLSQSIQDHAIKLGLENQSNLNIEFDPRWGEVLYISCVEGRMSDEQAGQYIAKLDKVKISMRDRVHAGSQWIEVEMAVRSHRNASLTGGSLSYKRTIQVLKASIDGYAKEYSNSGGSMNIPASIRVIKGGWMNTSITRSISLKRDRHLPNAGELLAFGLEYKIEVQSEDEERIIFTKTERVEQQIQVIHNNEPIVPTISDPKLAQQIAESLSIMPIQVTKELPEKGQYQSTVPALSITRQEHILKESISFRVFLRLNDPEQDHQEEIEIGAWVAAGPHNKMSGSQMEWRVDPQDANQVAFARETIDRMIQLGKADVILRSDALLAEDDSEIEQVIDMVMIFEDVPVQVVESISSMWNSGSGDLIKGKAIEDVQGEDSEQP